MGKFNWLKEQGDEMTKKIKQFFRQIITPLFFSELNGPIIQVQAPLPCMFPRMNVFFGDSRPPTCARSAIITRQGTRTGKMCRFDSGLFHANQSLDRAHRLLSDKATERRAGTNIGQNGSVGDLCFLSIPSLPPPCHQTAPVDVR